MLSNKSSEIILQKKNEEKSGTRKQYPTNLISKV